MKKLKFIIPAILGLAAIIGGILYFIGVFNPQAASVMIETSPASSVFIDDVLVGRTPYQQTTKPEEVTVKLVPESFEKPLVPYETKVSLVSGVETVIDWEFAETEESSSGVILSFDKLSPNETTLSTVSIPDSSQIQVDSGDAATTPYKTSIAPGEHTLVFRAPGYQEKTVQVKAQKGHQLTVFIKLSQTQEEQEEQEEEQEEQEERSTMLEILSTPVGFLRVRVKPTTQSEEIGRVEPGDTFELLEEDEDSGWYKIEYEEGEEGWISNVYANILEEEE